jgi:limonene-1,2-epoxide hydrolase
MEFCGLAKSVGEKKVKRITTAVGYSELKERIDLTRDGQVFATPCDAESTVSISTSDGKRKTYAVWERGTHLHPVLVKAANANDALLLARGDTTLAALGTAIASKALTRSEASDLASRGAVDLRD